MNNDRLTAETTTKLSPIVATRRGDILRVLFGGAMIGLFTSVLFFILSRYVFGVILCRTGSTETCTATVMQYSVPLSLVIGAIIALIILVQSRIYRPLLVVIAATVSLWNYQHMFMKLEWYQSLIASVVLFALMYALFAWLSRLRNFVVSLILIVITVVVVRIFMTM